MPAAGFDYLRDQLRVDVEAHTSRLITRFGAPGRVWAADLPALLPRLAERWELRIERMYVGGNSGVALRCRDRAGRPAVLKLSPDRAAIVAQTHTLRLFTPSGRTPEIHAAEPDLGALDGGDRGLVAVDPGGCVGDPCFDAMDYVFLNPTGTADDHAVRGMDYRLRAIAEAADLDRDRLAQWCRVFAPVLAVTALRNGAGQRRLERLLALGAA